MPFVRKYIARFENGRPGTGRVITEDSVHASSYDAAKDFFGKKHGYDNLLEVTEQPWRPNAVIRAEQAAKEAA